MLVVKKSFKDDMIMIGMFVAFVAFLALVYYLSVLSRNSTDPLPVAIEELEEWAEKYSREYPDATYFAITGVEKDTEEFTPPTAAEVSVPRQNLFTVFPSEIVDPLVTPHNVRLIIGNSPKDYKSVLLAFPENINIQLIRDDTHDKGEYTFRVWREKEEKVTRIQYRKNAEFS